MPASSASLPMSASPMVDSLILITSENAPSSRHLRARSSPSMSQKSESVVLSAHLQNLQPTGQGPVETGISATNRPVDLHSDLVSLSARETAMAASGDLSLKVRRYLHSSGSRRSL